MVQTQNRVTNNQLSFLAKRLCCHFLPRADRFYTDIQRQKGSKFDNNWCKTLNRDDVYHVSIEWCWVHFLLPQKTCPVLPDRLIWTDFPFMFSWLVRSKPLLQWVRTYMDFLPEQKQSRNIVVLNQWLFSERFEDDRHTFGS